MNEVSELSCPLTGSRNMSLELPKQREEATPTEKVERTYRIEKLTPTSGILHVGKFHIPFTLGEEVDE